MFSSIKIMFMAILISAVAGAGVYVVKLRADNATLKANQLQLDILVVDEMSMVDLSLMKGILNALPQESQLILV